MKTNNDMKKLILLLLAVTATMLVFSQCKKEETKMTVSMDKDTISLKADKPAKVTYYVKDNAGDVTVNLINLDPSTTIQNTFDKTSKTGEITFTTNSTDETEELSILEFSDGKTTVDKFISIHVSSSWSITPADPIQ